MSIDPRQLRYLMAIAECGSFTSAAERLAMSQPALSNSIALLERNLGVSVLDRTRRGSTLNAFGEILVRRASGLESLLSAAEEEVRLKAAGIEGPLIIGATPSVLALLLPEALCRLSRKSGPIDIRIVDGVDSKLLPALYAGELEIIVGPVGETFEANPEIQEVPLMDDPFTIVAAADNPICGREQVSLSELTEMPWVLPFEASSYRERLESFFRIANAPWPTNCIYTDSLIALEAIVRRSDRITIFSRLQAMGQIDRRLRTIPLKHAGTRTIGYKHRKNGPLSPLCLSLIAGLRAATAALDTP